MRDDIYQLVLTPLADRRAWRLREPGDRPRRPVQPGRLRGTARRRHVQAVWVSVGCGTARFASLEMLFLAAVHDAGAVPQSRRAQARSDPAPAARARGPRRRVGGQWQDGAMRTLRSPEVEALARFLADEASGREIRAVDVWSSAPSRRGTRRPPVSPDARSPVRRVMASMFNSSSTRKVSWCRSAVTGGCAGSARAQTRRAPTPNCRPMRRRPSPRSICRGTSPWR